MNTHRIASCRRLRKVVEVIVVRCINATSNHVQPPLGLLQTSLANKCRSWQVLPTEPFASNRPSAYLKDNGNNAKNTDEDGSPERTERDVVDCTDSTVDSLLEDRVKKAVFGGVRSLGCFLCVEDIPESAHC